MRKRLVFFFVFVFLVCTAILPAAATQQIHYETSVIHSACGVVEIDRVITVYDSLFRSSTKRADVTDVYKYSGKTVAEVTLSVTFSYDGNSAWVTNASGSHTTYNSWSYSGEKISKSGGTARLPASLFKLTEGTIAVNTPLTCSPTGQFS